MLHWKWHQITMTKPIELKCRRFTSNRAIQIESDKFCDLIAAFLRYSGRIEWRQLLFELKLIIIETVSHY